MRAPRVRYDAVHTVVAADGWPLSLYEYRPRSRDRRGRPVLAVHGGMEQANVYDLSARVGLAPWLAERGWHVFALDFRGRGGSLPRGRMQQLHARVVRGWSFRDLIVFDVPAAIAAACERGGAEQIDYVGHSMAGIAIYSHLARTQDARIGRVVTAGSPAGLRLTLGVAGAALRPAAAGEQHFAVPRAAAALVGIVPWLPIGTATSALAAMEPLLWPAVRRQAIHLGINAENMDRRDLRAYFRECLVGTSTGKIRSVLGEAVPEVAGDAAARMAAYRHPTLFLAGAGDRLVEPERIEETYALAGCSAKRLLLLGRAHGCGADYGHADFFIGKRAPREVFPAVAEWLCAERAEVDSEPHLALERENQVVHALAD